jgi:hypothetical protein
MAVSLSALCGILDISQPYGPSWPVKGITLPLPEAVPQFPHNSLLYTSKGDTYSLVTAGKDGQEYEAGTGLAESTKQV